MHPAAGASTSDADSSATRSSPIRLLYSHALQSVLAWLSLPELSAAIAVCKGWNAAERSMPRLQWSYRSVLSIRGSPLLDARPTGLARHISRVGMDAFRLELNAPILAKLSAALVNLRDLRCEVNASDSELPDPSLLPLPRSLVVLRIKASMREVPRVNALVVACSRLPSLTDLTFKTFRREIDFSPLSAARMPWLRRFSAPWIFPDNQRPRYSSKQVEQFREMTQINYLALSPISAATAQLLFALPNSLVALQTAEVFWPLTDETAILLPRLPHLTTLLQDHDLRLSSVSFLRALPALQSCTMHCGQITAPVGEFASSLSHCAQLTYLCLIECPFQCAALAEVLAALPLLAELSLSCCTLESLACFSDGVVVRSLRTLQLYSCSHPHLAVAELQHLVALQSLTSLSLHNVCAASATAADLSPFVPPSRRMRKLIAFHYYWRDSEVRY